MSTLQSFALILLFFRTLICIVNGGGISGMDLSGSGSGGGETSISTTDITTEWTDDGVISALGNGARWIITPDENANVISMDNHYWHGPYTAIYGEPRVISRSFTCPQRSKVSVSFSGVACNTESDDDTIDLYFNTVLKNSLAASSYTTRTKTVDDTIDSSFVTQSDTCTSWNRLSQKTVSGLAVTNAAYPFEIKFAINANTHNAWLAVSVNWIECVDPDGTNVDAHTTTDTPQPKVPGTTTKTEAPDTTTTETTTTTFTTATTTDAPSSTTTASTAADLTTSTGTTASSVVTTQSTVATTSTSTTTTSSTPTSSATSAATEPSSAADTTTTRRVFNEGRVVEESSTTEAESNEFQGGDRGGKSQTIVGLTTGTNLMYLIIGGGALVIVCVVIFIVCRVQRNKSIAKDIQFNIKHDIEADMNNVPKESASSRDMNHVAVPPMPNTPVKLQMEFTDPNQPFEQVGTFSNPSYPSHMAMSLNANSEIFGDALGNLHAVNDVLMDDVINDMNKPKHSTAGGPDDDDGDVLEGDHVTKGGFEDDDNGGEEDNQFNGEQDNAESDGEGDGEDLIAGPETTGGGGGGYGVNNDNNNNNEDEEEEEPYVPAPPMPPSDGIAVPETTGGGVSMRTPGWKEEAEDDGEDMIASPPAPPVPPVEDDEEDMIAGPETTGGGVSHTKGYREDNGEEEDVNAPPAPPTPPV